MSKDLKNTPKVLGLDVSTKTIGWSLFDIQTGELLELTHVSPRPKLKTENKIEELLAKAEIFKIKLDEYKNLGITKVVIEEPLLNSNNIYTVGTLLRYNSFITKLIHDVLGIIPEYITNNYLDDNNLRVHLDYMEDADHNQFNNDVKSMAINGIERKGRKPITGLN